MIWTYGQPVRVSAKLGVAGKAAADFTLTLTADGAASTLAVSVTELTVLGTGVYMFSFTPPDSSVKRHYCLRVQYGSPGDDYFMDTIWDVDIQPAVGGQTLRLEVQGEAGLTIMQAVAKDGNADAGVSFTITEDTDFGTGVYAAVCTLPESDVPYTLMARFYTADGSVDTTYTIQVQASYNNLINLETKLRGALGDPEYSELTYAQAQRAWEWAVKEYSKFFPREDYDTSIRTVANQKDYTLPDEEFVIDVYYCYIASTLAGLTSHEQYYKTYRDTLGQYTGYGSINFEMVNRKLRLLPAPETTGLYVGTLLHKEHIFSNGACTTIPPTVMETLILKGAQGKALEMMKGYGDTVRFGSATIDKGPVREDAKALIKEFLMEMSSYKVA